MLGGTLTFVITSYRRRNNSGMPGCDTFRDKATSKAATGCRTPGLSFVRFTSKKKTTRGRLHVQSIKVFDIVVPTGTSPKSTVEATASIVGLSEVYYVQHQGAQNFQVIVKSLGAMSLIVDAGYLAIGGERGQVVPVGP
ncbi:hypothetical protein HPB50_029011 [Hyalomma asiaticum]|nr:hypothetical protein HPB50_029011 [Hyalomma asiaticum]